MSKTPTLRNYLYQVISAQILTGQLKCGEHLPSWPQLHTRYRVGLRTVKEAMGDLQRDGYIATEKRKTAIVVYRSDAPGPDPLLKGFLTRRDAIIDAFGASCILLPCLITQGVRQLNQEKLAAAGKLRKKISTCPLRECHHHFCTFLELTLDQLENPLLSELFVDLKTYMELPLLPGKEPLFEANRDTVRSHLDTIFENLQSSPSKALTTGLKLIFSTNRIIAKNYLETLCKAYPIPLPTSVSFHWEAQKGRACRYSAIARDLMSQIFQGDLPTGRYLPSITTLSQSYQASPVTVRRAMGLLRNIGIIRSEKGKGSQLIAPMQINLWTQDPAGTIKEDLMLFLWTLQIIVFTCKDVAMSAFSSLSPEYVQSISDAARNPQHPLFVTALLHPIISAIPNPAVQDIYTQLCNLLERGWYLMFVPLHAMIFEDMHVKYISLMVGLRQSEGTLFSDEFYRMFSYLFAIVHQMVLDLGIREAEKVQLGESFDAQLSPAKVKSVF